MNGKHGQGRLPRRRLGNRPGECPFRMGRAIKAHSYARHCLLLPPGPPASRRRLVLTNPIFGTPRICRQGPWLPAPGPSSPGGAPAKASSRQRPFAGPRSRPDGRMLPASDPGPEDPWHGEGLPGTHTPHMRDEDADLIRLPGTQKRLCIRRASKHRPALSSAHCRGRRAPHQPLLPTGSGPPGDGRGPSRLSTIPCLMTCLPSPPASSTKASTGRFSAR